jgi:hypothetical protein
MRALCLLASATMIGQVNLNRHDHSPEIYGASRFAGGMLV